MINYKTGRLAVYTVIFAASLAILSCAASINQSDFMGKWKFNYEAAKADPDFAPHPVEKKMLALLEGLTLDIEKDRVIKQAPILDREETLFYKIVSQEGKKFTLERTGKSRKGARIVITIIDEDTMTYNELDDPAPVTFKRIK